MAQVDATPGEEGVFVSASLDDAELEAVQGGMGYSPGPDSPVGLTPGSDQSGRYS